MPFTLYSTFNFIINSLHHRIVLLFYRSVNLSSTLILLKELNETIKMTPVVVKILDLLFVAL